MNVIAVYPGRFHPFHKGHAGSYKQLADKFGLDNTYLAISAKQEQPKSPFSMGDRAKMAMVLGIPKEQIISVNNPYAAKEYIERLQSKNGDPENTAIVFGVSKKDMEGVPELGIPPDPRFEFKPKKDGTASYLQPYKSQELEPMTKHGYVISTDVAEFPIAGEMMRDASAIRKAYANADDKKELEILQDLYGKYAKLIKPMFDLHIPLRESITKFLKQVRPMLENATPEQKAKLINIINMAKSKLVVENKPVNNYDFLEEK
jgi:hypothetical protein